MYSVAVNAPGVSLFDSSTITASTECVLKGSNVSRVFGALIMIIRFSFLSGTMVIALWLFNSLKGAVVSTGFGRLFPSTSAQQLSGPSVPKVLVIAWSGTQSSMTIGQELGFISFFVGAMAITSKTTRGAKTTGSPSVIVGAS